MGSELGPSQQSSSTQRQPLVRALETKKGPGWVLNHLLHLKMRVYQAQVLPGNADGKFREQGRKEELGKIGKQMEKGWDQESSESAKRAQSWPRKAQWDLRKEVVKVQGKDYPKKETQWVPDEKGHLWLHPKSFPKDGEEKRKSAVAALEKNSKTVSLRSQMMWLLHLDLIRHERWILRAVREGAVGTPP